MVLIVYFYTKLFLQVRQHENLLKTQAKKMNIKSLNTRRHNDQLGKTAVEIRIAKACFTIYFLFVAAWTPYAIVALVGAFGDRSKITPVVSMVPAMAAKAVSCINPW